MSHQKKLSVWLYICTGLLLLALLSPALSALNQPAADGVGIIYLFDNDVDHPLFQKNASNLTVPASAAKMMTGLLAVENLYGDMDDAIFITKNLLAGADGKKIKAGSTWTVEKLISSLLLERNNDAAYVLANLIGEDAADFVLKMNEKSRVLGMNSTVWANPTGLDSTEAVTTAEDIGRLAVAFWNQPILRDICQNQTVKMNSITGYKLNFGMTDRGGYGGTFVTDIQGNTIYCVCMGGTTETDTLSIATSCLYWVKKNFSIRKVLDKGQKVASIPVRLSTPDATVSAVAGESFSCFLPNDLALSELLLIKPSVTSVDAPVAEGLSLGFVSVSYHGEVLADIPLVAGENVTDNSLLSGLDRFSQYLSGRAFIASVICMAVLFSIYFYKLIRKHKARKRLIREYDSRRRSNRPRY